MRSAIDTGISLVRFYRDKASVRQESGPGSGPGSGVGGGEAVPGAVPGEAASSQLIQDSED